MKATMRIWKIPMISLLPNTFSSVIWVRGWKLRGTFWGAESADCSARDWEPAVITRLAKTLPMGAAPQPLSEAGLGAVAIVSSLDPPGGLGCTTGP